MTNSRRFIQLLMSTKKENFYSYSTTQVYGLCAGSHLEEAEPMTQGPGVPYLRAGEKSRNLDLNCGSSPSFSTTGNNTFLGCPAEFITRWTTTEPPWDWGSSWWPEAFLRMPTYVHYHTKPHEHYLLEIIQVHINDAVWCKILGKCKLPYYR